MPAALSLFSGSYFPVSVDSSLWDQNHPRLFTHLPDERDLATYSTSVKPRFRVLPWLWSGLCFCMWFIPQRFETVFVTNKRVVHVRHNVITNTLFDSEVQDEFIERLGGVKLERGTHEYPVHYKLNHTILQTLAIFLSIVLPVVFLALNILFALYPPLSFFSTFIPLLSVLVATITCAILLFVVKLPKGNKFNIVDAPRIVWYFVLSVVSVLMLLGLVLLSLVMWIVMNHSNAEVWVLSLVNTLWAILCLLNYLYTLRFYPQFATTDLVQLTLSYDWNSRVQKINLVDENAEDVKRLVLNLKPDMQNMVTENNEELVLQTIEETTRGRGGVSGGGVGGGSGNSRGRTTSGIYNYPGYVPPPSGGGHGAGMSSLMESTDYGDLPVSSDYVALSEKQSGGGGNVASGAKLSYAQPSYVVNTMQPQSSSQSQQQQQQQQQQPYQAYSMLDEETDDVEDNV